MAKYGILPADMTLYSPAEPRGRVFLKGEPWPGDAWSERPGGDDVGKATVAEALKDLAAAQKQADDLRMLIKSAEHDRAQLAKELDEIKASVADREQAASDAVARAEAAIAEAREAVGARDDALKSASGHAARAEAALSDVERLTGELADANSHAAALEAGRQDDRTRIMELETDLANAQAKIAAFDGDGNGAPGGSKPRAKATAEAGSL